MGKAANIMGTAPLSPPQARNNFSFSLKPNLGVQSHTATGRAITIKMAEINKPLKMISQVNRLWGKTKSPKSVNIKICAIQAKPSLNLEMECRYAISEDRKR